MNPPQEQIVKCLKCDNTFEHEPKVIALCPECFDELEPIFIDWAKIEFEQETKEKEEGYRWISSMNGK